MSIYRSQIPILVNYQASNDPVNSGVREGTDYSNRYTDNKSCLLYIADRTSEVAVGLKAFLKSFNFTMKIEHEDQSLVHGKKHNIKGLGFSYSFEVVLPAISLNDAKINTARLEMLEIMITPSNLRTENTPREAATNRSAAGLLADAKNAQKKAGGGTKSTNKIPAEERQVVLLANLINNGLYRSKCSIKTFDDLDLYGVSCYIDKLSYLATPEMGFFESSSKLWPKEWTLKVDLTIPLTEGGRNLMLAFNEDGTMGSEYGGGYWPFGVPTK